MRTDTPKTIYLKDYTPPPYTVKHLDLRFEIFDGRTVVHASAQYEKAAGGALFLNGEDMKLLSVNVVMTSGRS